MRKNLFILFFICSCFQIQAQQQSGSVDKENMGVELPPVPEEEQVSTFVQVMPKFQGGGDDAFSAYVEKNIIYTKRMADTTGTVFVEYIIEKDGSVTNVKIVPRRGLTPVLNQAAIDVIKKSPKWQPGLNNGVPVRVKKISRIRFN